MSVQVVAANITVAADDLPGAPVAPYGGTVKISTVGGVGIRWAAPDDPYDASVPDQRIAYYQVQRATDKVFTTNLVDDEVQVLTTSHLWTVSAGDNDIYYMRVRSVDGLGNTSTQWMYDDGAYVSDDATGASQIPSGGAYVHTQLVPAATWTIVHNLGYYPAGLVVEDSGGNTIEGGEVDYVDANTLSVTYSNAFGGVAHLS